MRVLLSLLLKSDILTNSDKSMEEAIEVEKYCLRIKMPPREVAKL
jgi:hypothetical protein